MTYCVIKNYAYFVKDMEKNRRGEKNQEMPDFQYGCEKGRAWY